MKKEKWRRLKYACLTVLLCSVKMFLISTLQGGVTLFRDTSGSDENRLRMAFLFGYIIVGNIVDNISNPKILAIIL